MRNHNSPTSASKRSRSLKLRVESLEERWLQTTLPTVADATSHVTREVVKETSAARADFLAAKRSEASRTDHVSALTAANAAVLLENSGNAKIRASLQLARATPFTKSHAKRPDYDVALHFAYVRFPGNAPVGINGFTPPSRATVPAQPGNTGGRSYQNLGGVAYVYAIGQTEITAGQYVTFLNTVDPNGENPVQPVTGVQLWVENFSPVTNPFSGQINYVQGAEAGTHYRLGANYWRDKPLVNANLFHFAYFVNSLYNGSTVGLDNARAKSPLGFGVQTQTRYAKLSTQISTGMYDLADSSYPFFHRLNTSGYVIPSENEWVKAAYYSPYPTGNGTHFYYYPNGSDSPPTALQTGGSKPTVDGQGNIIRKNLVRKVSYGNFDSQVIWKPSYAPESSVVGANVVSVGQDRSPSPWLGYDMAGNVVEYTDTVTGSPTNLPNPRGLPVYVRAHGGVASASNWQLWLTATGTTDPYGQQAGLTATQGGARFGYVPNTQADRTIRSSKGLSASIRSRPLDSDGLTYHLVNINTAQSIQTSDLAEAVLLAENFSTYRYVGADAVQTSVASRTASPASRFRTRL